MIDKSPRGSWAYVLSQFPWVKTGKDKYENAAGPNRQRAGRANVSLDSAPPLNDEPPFHDQGNTDDR